MKSIRSPKKAILFVGIYSILILLVLLTNDVAITVSFDYFRVNCPTLNGFILFTTNFIIFLMIGIDLLLVILSFFVKPIKKYQKLIFAVNLALLSSFIFTRIIKNLVKRPRPCEDPNVSVLFHVMVYVINYSFPSGHSSSTWALIPPLINQSQRKSIKILWILIGLYIPFTRVYLGVHYFSDIVIGAIIGSVCWLISKSLFKINEWNDSKKNSMNSSNLGD